jgi:phage baseplate assembly protein W
MKHEGWFHGRVMPRLFGSLQRTLVASHVAEGVASAVQAEEINIDEAKARMDMARAEAAQVQKRLTFA